MILSFNPLALLLPMWCVCFSKLQYIFKNDQSRQCFLFDILGSSVLFLYLLSPSGYRGAVSVDMRSHYNSRVMQTYIHANMHSCTCIHAHMHSCKHACIRACIYKHTYVHACICTCTHSRAVMPAKSHMSTSAHACMRA